MESALITDIGCDGREDDSTPSRQHLARYSNAAHNHGLNKTYRTRATNLLSGGKIQRVDGSERPVIVGERNKAINICWVKNSRYSPNSLGSISFLEGS